MSGHGGVFFFPDASATCSVESMLLPWLKSCSNINNVLVICGGVCMSDVCPRAT